MLDTRELGRRPGSERKVSLTAPAPADLGIGVIGVPEGSDVELELRLEAVIEGVLATGTARVVAVGECVRCLESVEESLDVDIQELYAYDDGGDAAAGGDGPDDIRRLEGDLLDLESVLRDEVVLALPLKPLCRPDCAGLCPECGVRLADVPGHAHEEDIDPRWAALSRLTGDERPDDSGPDEE
ncbi:MAG TPA: DUF177 domain-containing protein [Nocardioidaceae bacterium]|nr:DUF177 domain-containing protein [Nocardioidaceae bacterium]